MKKFILAISGFLILDIYFNVTTRFISNSIIQFLCLILFFPLALFIARLNGLSGLSGLGMDRNRKSLKYFTVSFIIGFSIWALMYIAYWIFGKFEITGIKTGFEALSIFVQVLVGFFFGSLINDLITRGFVINVLKNQFSTGFIFLISVTIYALDDFWNGEFTSLNLTFSILLGCSLTYSYLKTNSIWADTGLHFGLNVAYGMVYGLVGKEGGGIMVITGNEFPSLSNNLILLTTATFLFLIVYLYYRKNGMLEFDKDLKM